jgi:hypothetical protein
MQTDPIHVLSIVVAHESKEAMKRMRTLREDTNLQYWAQCNQAMLEITRGVIKHENHPDIVEVPNPQGSDYFVTKLKRVMNHANHSATDRGVVFPNRFAQAMWSDLDIEEPNLERRFLIIETFAMALALHGFWTKIWHFHPKHRDFGENTSSDLRFSIGRNRYFNQSEDSFTMGKTQDVNAEREDVYPHCRQPWTCNYTIYPPCDPPPTFKKQKIDGVMHRPKHPWGFEEGSSSEEDK